MWTQCAHCELWFACDASKVRRGERKFCSRACTSASFVATGKFRGSNNPSWAGGVSNDNMRYRRRQAEKDPLKEAARDAVYLATKRGELVRCPCEVCGALKAEAHHDDYSKPLDVRWLCRTHHVEHHNRMRAPKARPPSEPPPSGEFVWRGKVRRW